jgi:cyclophilin family peptidyl-prolyl cis-trans isomerase
MSFSRHFFLPAIGLLLVFATPAQATVTVKLTTSIGVMTLDLDEVAKPKTVANFLRYIRDGLYDNSFAHRLPQGFVLQGGVYYAVNNSYYDISTYDPIPHESGPFPAFSNLKGTIAMALSGTGNDTATSSWFINLADNNGTSGNNLDTLNGGFTVFGKITSGQSVLDRFAAFQNYAGVDGADKIVDVNDDLDTLPLQLVVGGKALFANLIYTTWEIVGGTNPVITSKSTAYPTTTAPFNYQITATGSPMSFALTGDTLPAGLSFSTTTGVISGTVTETAPGIRNLNISATNGSGTGSATLSIAYNYPVIADNLTASAVKGQPFQFQIQATNNPTSYAAYNLPDGVTVNTTTGLISGTPTVSGSDYMTIYATNAGGTYSSSVYLTIAEPAAPSLPPVVSTKKKVTARNGVAILKGSASADTAKVEVQPGKGGFKRAKGSPMKWTFTVKGLKAGTYKFKVRATKADGKSTIAPVTVVVRP